MSLVNFGTTHFSYSAIFICHWVIQWTKVQSVNSVNCFYYIKKYIYLSFHGGDWFPLTFQVVKNDVLILASGCDQ